MAKGERSVRYKRILLKLSGEALAGADGFGISPQVLDRMALEIGQLVGIGVQVGLVIGGGNLFRGAALHQAGLDRVTGDHMGMLATLMNALAMQNALEDLSVNTRVLSALPISAVCEPYIRRRAKRHIEKGRVVIFAAGTGNPFFTTDTAAALRATEMNCDLILKGTRVDGVYSAVPEKDPDAIHHPQLTYKDVLSRDLAVMDASAISLARENSIPMIVFSIEKQGSFDRVLRHEDKFTLITDQQGG